MARCRFGDVVKEIKNNIDRENNPYDYYIAGGHMDSEELHIHRRGSFKTDDVGPAFIREFKKGQVLYGSRRTYLKKVAVADFDGVTANTTFVLETKDEDVLLQSILPFVMLSDSFTEWSIGKSKGSTNPYVLFSDLADYEFELPPLEKQRTLAKLLWEIDSTKCSYKDLIDKTDEVVKSQFIEMFGDPKNAAAKPGMVKGEMLFSLASGKANTIENLNDQYPYECYGGNGITGNSKNYLVKDPTIVIGRVGEYCGSVHMTSPFSWITDNAIYITDYDEKTINLEFLYRECQVMDFHRFAATVGQPKITQKPLLESFYIVPTMERQNQYVDIAEQSDKSKFELNEAIKDLDAMYKRIIKDNLG